MKHRENKLELEKGIWPWILCLGILAGCAQSLSPTVMATAEKRLTYEVVIQNPKAYLGSVILWGGVIRKTVYESEGTRLLVTHAPLDSKGYPEDRTSEGEFIVQSPRYLDPQTYREGVKISLVGVLSEVEVKKSGPEEYPVPVIKVMEMRAWSKGIWGVFPLTRQGWEVNQLPPAPSPFGIPPEKNSQYP
jgi:outer membrane lipoprotein